MTEVFCLDYQLKLINAHITGDLTIIYTVDYNVFFFICYANGFHFSLVILRKSLHLVPKH